MIDRSELAPSVFESFNARALEPHQVAETFIPPDHYGKLARRAHSLVVGPRGSGKTTLLKMLQEPALEAWKHPLADEYRARIDYTGVFIPTDISWNSQIESLGGGKLADEHRRLFANASFTTHILRQLVVSMLYRAHPPTSRDLVPHRRVRLERNDEATLVGEIATKWHLQPTLPSLSALKQALSQRLLKISEIASSEALLNSEGRNTRLASIEFLHLNFLAAAAVAVELFDDLAGASRGRWALLFDELELAPQWIRTELIRFLRSVDERFIFKLSMSPYSEDVTLLDSPTSAMAGHDHDLIPLWYAHKENSYSFCRALLQSMLKQHGINGMEAVDLLGPSEFETSRDEWVHSGTAYKPGSRLERRFLKLAKKDRSFRAYLAQRHIDPTKLNLLRGDERAAEIRKITSLVAIRNTFRGADEENSEKSKPQKRSRKNPDLYRGATSLFAMVEGNPRWFIGIIGGLLQTYSREEGLISPALQSDEVTKATNRFRALLKTIPCPATRRNERPRGVLSVLDPVGKFLFRAVVTEDFNPDPPGTFTVDAQTDSSLLLSLGRALNAGAIVYVPDEDSQLVLGSLRGKRFRLCYLLAPHYGIPIRLGRAVSLSAIIKPPRSFGSLMLPLMR